MPLEPHISRFSSRSTVNDVSALLTTPAPPFGELAAFCTVPIFVPKSYFQELFIFRNISISLGLQIHLLSLLPLISAYRGGGRCWGAPGCPTVHAVHRPFSRSCGHWNHAQKAFRHSLLQNISMSILSILGDFNFMFKPIIWKVFGYG